MNLLEVPWNRGSEEVVPREIPLTYSDGPRDAETLLVHPTTGQVFVVSKSLLGGVLYEAPQQLTTEGPNVLEPVGDVLGFATDGAFFPDGRHFVLRDYGRAVVYSYPDLEVVGELRLPSQEQGEGIAVDDSGAVFVCSEGQFSPVYRVRLAPGSPGSSTRRRPPLSPRPDPLTVLPVRTSSGWRQNGRPGCGCSAASWVSASSWYSSDRSVRADMVRLRKTLARPARLDPAPRGGGLRLPRRARRAPAGRARSADQGPGHPAGLAGRLGDAVRQRAPAGGRHRRGRSPPVPLPPGLAHPAGRREVRPDAGSSAGRWRRRGSECSPTSAARACRSSGPAPPPYACSTSATSGSATTSTPTSTAASG